MVHGKDIHNGTWERYIQWYMGKIYTMVHGKDIHNGTWERYTQWYMGNVKDTHATQSKYAQWPHEKYPEKYHGKYTQWTYEKYTQWYMGNVKDTHDTQCKYTQMDP